MNKNKLPSLVTIAMLTLITIIFWIFFSVFRLLTTKPSNQVPDEILRPLTPTLGRTALEKLQKRVFVSETELGNLPVSTAAGTTTPTATAEPTPQATPTVAPSPIPTTQP